MSTASPLLLTYMRLKVAHVPIQATSRRAFLEHREQGLRRQENNHEEMLKYRFRQSQLIRGVDKLKLTPPFAISSSAKAESTPSAPSSSNEFIK